MLTIYLPYSDVTSVCVENDLWFDGNAHKLPDTKEVRRIIKKVDGVEYQGQGFITAKFSLHRNPNAVISAKFLSTGCKTVLNVLLYPDQIFSVVGCGQNAFEEILRLNEGKIYLPCFKRVSTFKKPVRIIGKGINTTVTSCDQYITLVTQYEERYIK